MISFDLNKKEENMIKAELKLHCADCGCKILIINKDELFDESFDGSHLYFTCANCGQQGDWGHFSWK